MKKYKSPHTCGFCTKRGIEANPTNSCDLDIELVINDKYIVVFPAMIMHYLINTTESHGWENPWLPPNWFMDAILNDVKIVFPPTLLQEHTLPIYHVGYLTTKQQLRAEYGGIVPEKYQLESSRFPEDVIVDTQGGDANFINATAANFGKTSPTFISRLNYLCQHALSHYYVSAYPEKFKPPVESKEIKSPDIEKMPHGQLKLTMKDVSDFEITLPPKKVVPPLKFGTFVRCTAYGAYSETKEFKNAVDQISSGENPTILTRLIRAPETVNHFDYLKLFRALCYTAIEKMKWHQIGDSFEAKIDLSETAFNQHVNYAKNISFEEMKTSFLEVFNELEIKNEGIIFANNTSGWSVRIPRASLKHIEEKNIEITAVEVKEARDEVKSPSVTPRLFSTSTPPKVPSSPPDSTPRPEVK